MLYFVIMSTTIVKRDGPFRGPEKRMFLTGKNFFSLFLRRDTIRNQTISIQCCIRDPASLHIGRIYFLDVTMASNMYRQLGEVFDEQIAQARYRESCKYIKPVWNFTPTITVTENNFTYAPYIIRRQLV